MLRSFRKRARDGGRACVPGAMPRRSHVSGAASIASTIFVCWSSPGAPSGMELSAGPIIALKRYIVKETARRPPIMPVILEV